MLRSKKVLETKIINQLEVIKLLPLRSRLYRLAEISKYHPDFAAMLSYWVFLYEKQTQQLGDLISLFQKSFKNDQKSLQIRKIFELKKILNEVNILNQKSRQLLLDYENSIKIELTQREQVSLYKNFFNQLVNDATKIQIYAKLNNEKLKFLINTIQNMFHNFEIELNKGSFLQSYKILDKIGLGLISLACILDKIPQLIIIVDEIISRKLEQMELKYNGKNIEATTQQQFQQLFVNTKIQIKQIKKMLDELQYKKVQKRVEEVLTLLINFDNQTQQQQDLKSIFTIYYPKIIKLVNNIEESFINLNKEVMIISEQYLFLPIEKELISNSEKLVKQLTIDANNLVVIFNKKIGYSYNQLVKLQVNLLDNALKIQINLEAIHKLINKKTADEKQLKNLSYHLGIILMQLNTKMNKMTYHVISQKFKNNIETVYKDFLQLKKLVSLTEDLQEQKRLLHKFYLLKDIIYKLFNKIRNMVIMDQLVQIGLVYGYKFCELDADFNNKLKSAQLIYNNYNYDDALQLILQALEYSTTQRLHKKLQRL